MVEIIAKVEVNGAEEEELRGVSALLFLSDLPMTEKARKLTLGCLRR